MKPIKTIKRTLLISLVPLITPLTALAQTGNQSEQNNPGTKGSAPPWRASQVIGTDVKNAASETIGEVEDLVLDMKDGEILAVVISSGGFLGIGEALSAVPVAVLRYDVNAKAFKTKLTKEQLGRAPQFMADEWPDYSDATSSEALRTFRDSISGEVTAPDSTTRDRDTTTRDRGTATRDRDTATRDRDSTARDRDNTAQNKKAVNRNAPTPMNQGNSARDIQITRDIRSDIMDTDLSFNAKNIKIITRDERVTLKGVVDSETEHQAILKIAVSHCDESSLTDNLQVKFR